MNCVKCGKLLTGSQIRFCSRKCSKNYLKAEYRKRNREKVNEYNRIYRSKGLRPLATYRKKKVIAIREGKCERCGKKFSLDVHHIKPLRAAGDNKRRNLLVFCQDCHYEWEKRMKGFWIDVEKDHTNKDSGV